jgi:hypothetical protein
MRRQQECPCALAAPAGSSLILLAAICAALLAAEPPAGRNALRHFEGQVGKAKLILHQLSAAAPASDAAQIQELVAGLLGIAPFAAALPVRAPLPAAAPASVRRFPALTPLFERPPPRAFAA